jgi:hypothetical protein
MCQLSDLRRKLEEVGHEKIKRVQIRSAVTILLLEQ